MKSKRSSIHVIESEPGVVIRKEGETEQQVEHRSSVGGCNAAGRVAHLRYAGRVSCWTENGSRKAGEKQAVTPWVEGDPTVETRERIRCMIIDLTYSGG